ncbi:hypothetical protein ABZT02_20475 [Streptomyces sp. NPDC005402]|uniref:hypothetical protein n=1 Tax=Streptomyces sp. NPDC005402 TaxID=3155338 RepID=UPI0033AC1169
MVRRRERREIRATGSPMPYDDGLPEGQHGPEHHTQHRDGTDTPDGGGTPVRTIGGDMSAGEPDGSTTDIAEPADSAAGVGKMPLTAGAGHHEPPRLHEPGPRPPHGAEPDVGEPPARVTPSRGPAHH